ncbi:MAG: hypothetical protein RL226_826, partial [Bacteroidota bacterium]
MPLKKLILSLPDTLMKYLLPGLAALSLLACSTNETPKEVVAEPAAYTSLLTDAEKLTYTTVRLTTDTSLLSDEDKRMIPILIQAGEIMNDLFWQESFGVRDTLLAGCKDEQLLQYVHANYGPWDRLNNNTSFIAEYGEKPAGAQFYPLDMTKEEFEAWNDPFKTSLYTMVRRDSTGALTSVFYHEYFAEEVSKVASLLREAATITSNASFKFYLEERAKALETDRYNASDIAWLQLKDNSIDVVIGPIENYEDHLFGYKAAHECYILVKDQAWSQRLERYSALLPGLQQELPCDPKYKKDP